PCCWVSATRAACPARRKPAEAGSAGSPRKSCASSRHPKVRPVDPPKQTVDAEDDERSDRDEKYEQGSLASAATCRRNPRIWRRGVRRKRRERTRTVRRGRPRRAASGSGSLNGRANGGPSDAVGR